MRKPRKNPKKNNAHLVNKDKLVKQAHEMEFKLINRKDR